MAKIWLAGIIGVDLLQMDQIKTLCNNIRANILNALDGCQMADTSKFKGVEYVVRGLHFLQSKTSMIYYDAIASID